MVGRYKEQIYLVLWVPNSVSVYGEGGLALGQAGAVVDLADSSLPSTFPEKILKLGWSLNLTVCHAKL